MARYDEHHAAKAAAEAKAAMGTLGIDAAAPGLILDHFTTQPKVADLGEPVLRQDIKTTIGPFSVLPEYQTEYPQVVLEALGDLYQEYNDAFGPLVEQNREWATDYQYCVQPDGTPNNRWVQIDMVGLPDDFLQTVSGMDRETVREILRSRVFELENSLAMYQLLENIFARQGEDSRFKQRFIASLDELRRETGKPIALLAVTDQKHQAMRESEFGKTEGEPLTDDEVRELSGFDRFFGPDDFKAYLEANGGQCDYLIYARTSEPVAKLRRPDTVVHTPLLEDPYYRQIIKANTITMNVDRPNLAPDDPSRINDTKAYMSAIGMAFTVNTMEDLQSDAFKAYLASQGYSQEEIEAGHVTLRAKPTYASYGGYGHQHSELANKKFRDDLRAGLRKRGPHVVQSEMKMPTIVDAQTGQAYMFIDRNFFAIVNGKPVFMGGFRSMMPTDTTEAGRGRVHGNANTVWAEIR